MSTFIVPLDGSESGDQALRLGHDIAASLGAGLGIVLVNGASRRSAGSYPDNISAPIYGGVPVRFYTLKTGLDQDFLAWVSGLEQPIVVLDTEGPTSEIVDWIVRNGGPSVTTLVGKRGDAGLRLQRIMVPLDGSKAAEQALPLASQLAMRSGAVLGIIQIVPVDHQISSADTIASVEHARDEARAYLDGVATELRTRGISVSWEVRIGLPEEEIARAAETTDTDLIIMASRRYLTSLRHTLGVTTAAIEAAHIPVIVTHITA